MAHKSPENVNKGLYQVSKLVQMFETANNEASPPPVTPHGLGQKPSGVMTNKAPVAPLHETSQGAQQEVEQVSNVAPRSDTSTEGEKILGKNGTVAPDIEVIRGSGTDNGVVPTVTLTCDDNKEMSSGSEIANSLLTEEGQDDCAEQTVLRHPTATLKPNQEVKKRSGFIEDDHVIESLAETIAIEQADDITAEASKCKSLQKQDHMEECTLQASTSEVATPDRSALLDSGKGDSVHGEPNKLDEIPPEPIYVDFKEDENIPPTKFQEGFDKLTTSDQRQETFSQWLDKVKDTWKADCPVSLDDASQLNEIPGSHLKQLGKAFNEIIVERLGKPPEINLKPGKKPPKDPVYLFLGSTAKEDFIKRLHIACRAFHGVTRDLNAIGIILEEKQLQKKRLRRRLKASITHFDETLQQLGADVVKLLALDANALKELAMHKVLLDQDKCPIVVAGQVSSGKSSLLNLFISAVGKPELHKATSKGASDEMSTQEAGSGSSVGDSGKPFTLPVSTLACTGRVCEISYGCSRTAMVHHVKTGETTEFSAEELEQYVDMHKKDASYKDNDQINDIVQLGLPIPFLKGGITLVDTPGVGENPIDSEVVKTYIKAHSVFGFIFTIHTSAGSGVNEKFQQLLRELSTYRDENGHKKLDPECVVFVCNFWDQIHETERVETKTRVLNILKETGFMKDFDPEQQLFFMDSKGAFETWNIGFVAEDYDRLIGGMERFFDIGHKRKIMRSYVWFNSLVQRVMCSMKFVQVWARDMEADSMQQIYKELDAKLDTIERQYHGTVKGLRNTISKAAEFLSERLLKSLQIDTKPNFQLSEEDLLFLISFKPNSEIQEYKIDEMIDGRINTYLNAWEAGNNTIHKTKVKIVHSITKKMRQYDTRLDGYERQTLSAEQFKETPGSSFAPFPHKAGHLLEDIKLGSLDDPSSLNIFFGRTYGDEIMKGWAISKRESLAGASVITNFAKRKHRLGKSAKVHVHKAMGKINKWRDFESYFKYRAEVIFEEMRHEESLKNIMLTILDPVNQLIKNVMKATEARIQQNRELISMINMQMMTAVGTREKRTELFALSDKMSDIFDTLLKFGYETEVEQVIFNEHNLTIDFESEYRSESTCGVLVPGEIHTAFCMEHQLQPTVTIGLLEGFLSESEQLELVKHLRNISVESVHRFTPTVLGLCHHGYSVVFEGHLITMRQYFFTLELSEPHYRHKVVNFIQLLLDALQFIHSQDLVTGELSLDTVVLQVTPTGKIGPLFTNLREKGRVSLPGASCATGNSIYLPPEVLHHPGASVDRVDSWYTAAGDIYGLGVMLLELFHKQDFLQSLKNNAFGKWCTKNDPGQSILIIFESSKKSSSEVPSDWRDICRICVNHKAKDRPTVENFRQRWEMKIRPTYTLPKDTQSDTR